MKRLDTDVCILGSGPHGLAAALHLRKADPDLNITALDPSGEWLAGWNEQFARAEIMTLRSPPVHHPSPDPYALRQFIDEHRLARSGLAYDLPTTAAFGQFCEVLISEADLDSPLEARPHTVRSEGKQLTIEAGDVQISARYLVVATNPHRRTTPEWAWPLAGHQPDLVAHGSDVDLRALADLAGQDITVIGGGLTAAHLALGAATRGAQVQLMSRKRLDVRAFDTAPGWLGPKYLAGFDAEADPARRLAIARRARPGGSIPEWMHTRLQNFDGPGEIRVRESTSVRSGEASRDGGCSLRLQNDERVRADRVWVATGTQAAPDALRCLRPLLADVGDVHGFPLLDEHLRMGPHPAFMMGRAAMLTLGPAVGNLWGAQRGAHRITEAITGIDVACMNDQSEPQPARN